MVETPLSDSDGALLFVTGSLILGAFIRSALNKIPLPYTVYLMIFGFTLGTGLSLFKENSIHSFLSVLNIKPPTLLTVFLPAIIFESSFGTDAHTFQKCIGQIIILSLIGYIIAAILHALFAYFAMSIYNWNFYQCLLYGVVLSATDPVAVVAILKELGTSKHLSVIIEGESLLNDGAAIVFFHILSDRLDNGFSNKEILSAFQDLIIYLLKSVIGGILSGYVAAKIEIFWLSRIHSDLISEITITFSMPYILFIICDHFEISGVLAIVILGLILNANKACLTDKEYLNRFWELLAYFCNTIIFVVVGLLISDRFLKLEVPYLTCAVDFILVFEAYLFANLIRLCVFLLLSFLLMHLGYGFTWKDTVISVWGGLRGAVGLVLAMNLAVSSHEPVFVNHLLIHTAGIVMLTLLFNATTVGLFMDLLGGNDILIAKQLSMLLAIEHLNKIKRREIISLKQDKFLADSDWTSVESTCVIDNPYIRTKKQQLEMVLLQKAAKRSRKNLLKSSLSSEYTSLLNNRNSTTEKDELFEEARFKILQSMKANFWILYYEGQLTHQSLYILNDYCEIAQDKQRAFINIKELIDSCKAEGFYYKILFKLKAFFRYLIQIQHPCCKSKTHKSPNPAVSTTKNINIYLPPKNMEHINNKYRNENFRFIFQKKLRKILIHIKKSTKYNIIVTLFIIFNCVQVTIPFLFSFKSARYNEILSYLDILSVILLLVDFVLKIHIYGFSKYLKNVIHVIELLLVISNCVFLGLVTFGVITKQLFHYLNTVNYLRFLYLLFNIRLWKTFLNKILDWVNFEFNQSIFISYGVTKGYILGIEFVLKHIYHFVATPELANQIETILRKDCDYALDELTKIQNQHPGTVVSVKTKHSIQRILAVLTKGIDEMSFNGIIDEKESDKILHQISLIMKKKIRKLPNSMAQTNCEPSLQSSVWLRNCRNVIDLLANQTRPQTYSWDQIVCTEGGQFNGIYFIVSGIVEILPAAGKKSSDEGRIYENLLSTGEKSYSKSHINDINSITTSLKPLISDCTTSLYSEKASCFNKHDIYCERDFIGAFEFLNKTVYQHTCKCITNATIYHISNQLLETIIKQHNKTYRLIERLWLEVSINIAENLLLSLNHDKMYKIDLLNLRRKLLYSYIKIDFQKEFLIDLEVILIQGRVVSKTVKNVEGSETQEQKVDKMNSSTIEFVGPCLISKNVMTNGVCLSNNHTEGMKIVMLVLSEKIVSRKVGISLANIS